MFGRRPAKPLPPKPPRTPLAELRENIQTLKDLISLTKEELKLTPRRPKPQRSDDAQFIQLSHVVENHIVEVIRRISEIAVLAEQRAATILLSEDQAGDNSIGGISGADSVHENDVFDYFCEKNVVGVIINIATGAAFMDVPPENLAGDSLEFASSIDSVVNNGASKGRFIRPTDQPIFLPPTRVTVQAIQSISILVQNVKMTTSLYLLLSNNKVNDLIKLPLHLYSVAERHQLEEQSTAGDGSVSDSVIESSELRNIFVAFLKSLAMKMNPETLQFYLSYPPVQQGSSQEIDYGSVEFPLYERALQFCNPDEDVFVRVTAMNLCLNTLRLATSVDSNEESNEEEGGTDDENGTSDGDNRPDMKKNPQATSSLPLRERLAVAHYVCAPARVQSLCAGIFTRLATLCGKVEDSIRTMERIDRGISAKFVSIDQLRKLSSKNGNGASNRIEEEKKEIEKLQMRRIKVVQMFLGDIVSDFQDEMMSLEDVLTVGLVPLNEQIIEMMFPTVMYPLVLTPLHNFINRVSGGEPNDVNPVGPKPLKKHFSRPLSRGVSTNSTECDSSLAKSALFTIASVYHFISHEEILNLLLTALLHPLAPDVTSAATVAQKTPEIVYEDENGIIHIKTDRLQENSGLKFYNYGNVENDVDEIDREDETSPQDDCIFVFAPILSEIFKWSVSGKTSESLPENLTRNRYRRTLLSCLSGTDGMADLQSLAVYAIDAMLSTVDKNVLNNIIFGNKIHREIEFRSADEDLDESIDSDADFSTSVASTVHSASTSNHMLEFIACMSVSIISATITFDGLWSLKYNPVSAHAIYGAAMIEESVKDTAVKFIRHRRYQSGKFVSETPSRLEKYEEEKEIDANLKMDRVFFEAFCDGDTFVVENVLRKKGTNPDSIWDGPPFIAVAKDGNMLDFAKQICQDISAKHIIGHDCEEAAYRCGANSALSHIQLDAFSKLLKSTNSSPALSRQQKYLGVATQASWSQRSLQSKKNGEKILNTPLSEKFARLLFNEEDKSLPPGPKPGDLIKLVGRKPFACVCEINAESEVLVTNKDACVIADGVRWQSLYLVLLQKHMILTEPGDGGYGRVVTCCPLSCLLAESYDNNDADQGSPARRLLLTHFSPERQVPGLFVVDNKVDYTGDNNEVRISRCCLDIWFEDANSGTKAHKALCHRIFKARIERGKQIRQNLPRS